MNLPDGRPTVVSLFAGCGGSSLGYRWAGYRELLAVEWDDHAAATFRLNFPDVALHHGDVAALSVEECLATTGLAPGKLDVLDGSPPCQGFSKSGQRRVNDPRSQLFREYCRLLKGLRPKAFVMENVPALVEGKTRLIAGEIFRELEACGYRVRGRILNAAHYGVAQQRRRLIVLGVRDDLASEPSFPAEAAGCVTVRQALVGLPEVGGCTLSAEGIALWRRLRPGQGFDEAHPREHWWNATKVDPCRPAPTIVATVIPSGASGLFHWRRPRVFTIPELMRVASFPDEYRFPEETRTAEAFRQQWRRIGNSVPPLLMKAVAAHLRDCIR